KRANRIAVAMRCDHFIFYPKRISATNGHEWTRIFVLDLGVFFVFCLLTVIRVHSCPFVAEILCLNLHIYRSIRRRLIRKSFSSPCCEWQETHKGAPVHTLPIRFGALSSKIIRALVACASAAASFVP